MSAVWLSGARVIDGSGSDPLDRCDVLIEDGIIAELGTAPAGAETIELDGFTLTPGLIDAHVHFGLSSALEDLFGHKLSVAEIAADMFNNAAQTLDAGYTTVRDCGGVDGGLARAISSGKVPGPRLLQCGPIQCQSGGHGHLSADWEPTHLWDTHSIPGLCAFALLSDGTEQMRANVRETFRRGADFIKMCVTGGVVSSHDVMSDTQLTVEEIAVAVQEAQARGTYVTVHAHNNEGIRNAVKAGATCVEHGSGIDEQTAALMAAHGVSHVPTLAVVEQLLQSAAAVGLPAEITERAKVIRQGQIDGVLVSTAAGVQVGLGSDLIGPDQTRRSHELLLRSELQSPMQALLAATSINARILRIADQVGTIEVGKRADLVAWRSDPVESPKTFTDRTQVALIVKAGTVVKDIR